MPPPTIARGARRVDPAQRRVRGRARAGGGQAGGDGRAPGARALERHARERAQGAGRGRWRRRTATSGPGSSTAWTRTRPACCSSPRPIVALRQLGAALAARRIVRRYAALSWGHIDGRQAHRGQADRPRSARPKAHGNRHYRKSGADGFRSARPVRVGRPAARAPAHRAHASDPRPSRIGRASCGRGMTCTAEAVARRLRRAAAAPAFPSCGMADLPAPGHRRIRRAPLAPAGRAAAIDRCGRGVGGVARAPGSAGRSWLLPSHYLTLRPASCCSSGWRIDGAASGWKWCGRSLRRLRPRACRARPRGCAVSSTCAAPSSRWWTSWHALCGRPARPDGPLDAHRAPGTGDCRGGGRRARGPPARPRGVGDPRLATFSPTASSTPWAEIAGETVLRPRYPRIAHERARLTEAQGESHGTDLRRRDLHAHDDLRHPRRSRDSRSWAKAETGVQAVERYKPLRPDLVTMDIVMPDMGGIDAVREITSSTRTRRS